MKVMKTAIITGASTGIGRVTSVEMARNGFRVFLVARRQNELEKTRRLVMEIDGQAEVFSCDLSQLDSVRNLIHVIRQKTNILDSIINIAGVWHDETKVFAGKDYETFESKVILDTFSVGIIAPALLVHGGYYL